MSHTRTFADPPRWSSDLSMEQRRARGRSLRDEVSFADSLETASSGIDVWLCGHRGLESFTPVVLAGKRTVLDVVDVRDALPGPWELDVVALARQVAVSEGPRFVADAAAGYQQALAELGGVPLHAMGDQALAVATRALGSGAGLSATGAENRFVTGGDHPRLRRDRVAARWGSAVVDAPDAAREFAHYRETVSEALGQLMLHYRVVDALADESGRLLVLLNHGRGDVIVLEAIPVDVTPLEDLCGSWRDGSDLQRVLLAGQTLPLAPTEMMGWTTSSDGSIARAWSRARALSKGKPADLGGRRRRARLHGLTLGLLHGRTGDAATLAGFLGQSEKFPRALTRLVN